MEECKNSRVVTFNLANFVEDKKKELMARDSALTRAGSPPLGDSGRNRQKPGCRHTLSGRSGKVGQHETAKTSRKPLESPKPSVNVAPA